MQTTLDAVYEGGILSLLERVDLAEHTRVRVTIALDSTHNDAWLDRDSHDMIESQVGPEITLDQVCQGLAPIADSMAEVVMKQRAER